LPERPHLSRGVSGLGLQIAEALGEQGGGGGGGSRSFYSHARRRSEGGAGAPRGSGHKSDWIAADNCKEDDVTRIADEHIDKWARSTFWSTKRAPPGALPRKTIVEAWDKLMNLKFRSRLAQPAIGKLSDDSEQIRRHHQSQSICPDSRAATGGHANDSLSHRKGQCGIHRALAGDGDARITVNALAPASSGRK